MDAVFRAAGLYTLYNLAFLALWAAFPRLLSAAAKDVARANTALIAGVVAWFWLSGQNVTVARRLFVSWWNDDSATASTVTAGTVLAVAFDVAVHFLPVIAIGLPTRPVSVLIAYGLLLAWYFAVRKIVPSLYVDLEGQNYDEIVATWGACVAAALIVNAR